MTDKRTVLLKKYAPMTKEQLRGVVADYAALFPEWTLLDDGSALVRRLGPIRQTIWFQNMRDYYRPTHGIVALALPDAHIRMLPQVLDVKHREVEHRLHERKRMGVTAAMEQQFRPDIRKPIVLEKVLTLCEQEAASMSDTTNNMTMLAILRAWLGHKSAALDCCERLQHCALPTLAPMPEWEEAMRGFGRNLAEALKAGTERRFLETTARSAESLT